MKNQITRNKRKLLKVKKYIYIPTRKTIQYNIKFYTREEQNVIFHEKYLAI